MEKVEIRKNMGARRTKLSKEEVLEYSAIIWREIYAMGSFKKAQTILLYSSFGQEVSTAEIAKKALDMGKVVCYPVTNMSSHTMTFHQVKDLSELGSVRFGSFSLREPAWDPSTLVVPGEHTLMIVPGLAFDRDGYRVGYGGGFYDRYIARYPFLTTLGVCYSFQLIDHIPRSPFDKPVGGPVTEISGE